MTMAAELPGPQGPAPAAVTLGYTLASTWEQNAPLTDEQLAVVVALAKAVSHRPLPPHLRQEQQEQLQKRKQDQPEARDKAAPSASEGVHGPAAEPSPSASGGAEAGDAVAPMVNSHQFYKWHSELEAGMKEDTEEKYKQYVQALAGHLEACDTILAEVDSTLGLFDQLQAQHRAVAVKTKTLHDACERLVREKERLLEFADALRSKLNFYEELDNIAAKFHSSNAGAAQGGAGAGPAMGVTSAHFLPLLKRLDECISYVSSNLQYADSGVYLVKFRQLQTRALGMVRSHVLAVLRSASSQVLSAMRESAGGVTTPSGRVSISEGAETSLLYVRFKAAAGELKALMEEMESRAAARQEYAQLLSDCQQLYCDQRLALLHWVVQQRISEYARREPLPALTRSGCAYLIHVCQLEHQLFDHFFPSSAADAANLAPLIDPLCMVLYDALRPRFIHEADVDLLCELVDIVRAEVLEEQLQRRGETIAGLRPTVLRILADLQERLTFRAHTFMRDEISNYIPTPEDLDYPAKLEQIAAAASVGAAEGSGVGGGEGQGEDENRDAYAGWYPPLESTLACLSKLYRCVDPNIFTGLAQEAVSVCTDSIQRAGKVISRKASPTDGALFLIKHLLILREQIAPFDVEFAVTIKELDFAHTLDHVRRVLRGQASFLSLTSGANLARLSPRVTESQVDSKRELEKTLKATCEQFIMSATKTTVEPFLSFITKVTAVRVQQQQLRGPPVVNTSSGIMLKADGPGPDGAAPAAPGVRALRDQAFASPQKVAEVVGQVNEALEKKLPELASKMQLYLQHGATRAVLFKPIKSNVMEAYGQVRTLIESEFTPEDRAQILLFDAEALQAKLDALI